MPTVCVNDCGIAVDGGAIALDFGVLGVKVGSASDDAYSSTIPYATDGMERARYVRDSYSNQTCRPMQIAWFAEIPHVNMNMVAGNYWDCALYTTGQSGAQPDGYTFSMSTAARCRLSHPGGSQMMRMSWPNVSTRRSRAVVAPGATFHMLATFWRAIIDRQDDSQNLMSWPSMTLKWEAWPTA